jgi:hypothetical protein
LAMADASSRQFDLCVRRKACYWIAERLQHLSDGSYWGTTVSKSTKVQGFCDISAREMSDEQYVSNIFLCRISLVFTTLAQSISHRLDVALKSIFSL